MNQMDLLMAARLAGRSWLRLGCQCCWWPCPWHLILTMGCGGCVGGEVLLCFCLHWQNLDPGFGKQGRNHLRKVHLAQKQELSTGYFCADSGILWSGDPQALVQCGQHCPMLGLD